MIYGVLRALQEKLSQDVPAIKYIDEDWGQLDYYADNPPIKFPAVLVEIGQAQWKNQGRLSQDGQMMVSLMVADMKLNNTSGRAPEAQKTGSKSIWQMLNDIHVSLHGWNPQIEGFGLFSRVSSRRIKREDGIREIEVVYAIGFTDHSAHIQEQSAATTVRFV